MLTFSKNHKMITRYRQCTCKIENCSLRYQYRHCEYVEDWQLFPKGTHPFVPGTEINTKPGLGLKMIELIEELFEANPDIKPSIICSTLTKRRKKEELRDRANAFNLFKNINYIPKSVNKKYLFDKEMLPSLRKVKFYLLTHFYSTLN